MLSFSNISHLGLVSGTAKYLKIAEFIDSKIPKSSNNQKLSYGEIFVALLVNALSFTARPMYLSTKFFKTMDLKQLLGRDVDTEWLNDDAIGRTLDILFEYGISDLYLELAAQAFNLAGIKYRIGHLDSTSFHYHGESYDEEPVCISVEKEPKKTIKIAQGYSRDAHPELKQVMLQMISDTVSGSPLFMKPQNGNTNDTKGFNQAIELVKSMKGALSLDYLVADAALYSEKNLRDAKFNGVKIVTRAPQKIKEVQEAVTKANELGFSEINENYSGCFIDSDYGDVKQKWLVVHSKQADKREVKAIDERASKELAKKQTELKKLMKQGFSCQPDADKELKKFEKTLKLLKLSDKSFTTSLSFSKPGRHKQGEEPDVTTINIDAKLELDTDAITIERQEAGCFVIATNDVEKDWEMSELLSIYKDQQKVERGFRFLKSPKFFTDSIFIKTPHRIESLLMIMVSCLLVYSLSEYLLRQKLKEQNKFVPDQVNKPTNRPTMTWIYDLFMNIGSIKMNGKKMYTTLEPEQVIVIETLGYPWTEIYKENLNSKA